MGLAADTLVCRLRMKTFVGGLLGAVQVYVGGNGWDAGTIPTSTINPLGRNMAVFCSA